jgi:hypothetical protein
MAHRVCQICGDKLYASKGLIKHQSTKSPWKRDATGCHRAAPVEPSTPVEESSLGTPGREKP